MADSNHAGASSRKRAKPSRTSVIRVASRPRLLLFPDFLSRRECEALKHLAQTQCGDEWELPSLQHLEIGQTYHSAMLVPGPLADSAAVSSLYDKINRATGLGASRDDVGIIANTSAAQAVDLGGSGPAASGAAEAGPTRAVHGINNLHHDHNGGESRRCTFMVYLSDVDACAGGETVFPTAHCTHAARGAGSGSATAPTAPTSTRGRVEAGPGPADPLVAILSNAYAAGAMILEHASPNVLPVEGEYRAMELAERRYALLRAAGPCGRGHAADVHAPSPAGACACGEQGVPPGSVVHHRDVSGVGLMIRPRLGLGVLFDNVSRVGGVDHAAWHSPARVCNDGDKWIFTCFKAAGGPATSGTPQ